MALVYAPAPICVDNLSALLELLLAMAVISAHFAESVIWRVAMVFVTAVHTNLAAGMCVASILRTDALQAFSKAPITAFTNFVGF
jgi:hypothetical protein